MRFLGFRDIIQSMIKPAKKQKIVKEWQKHETDSGSAEVQIALLTQQIKELSTHLRKNKKDNHSRRGLLRMVAQRRALFKYLQRTDEKSYNRITRKLKLKKLKKT